MGETSSLARGPDAEFLEVRVFDEPGSDATLVATSRLALADIPVNQNYSCDMALLGDASQQHCGSLHARLFSLEPQTLASAVDEKENSIAKLQRDYDKVQHDYDELLAKSKEKPLFVTLEAVDLQDGLDARTVVALVRGRDERGSDSG